MGVTGTYFSLRAKLLVLLFLVLAPVFGLIIYSAAIDNQRVAAEARAASSQLARTAADGQSNFIDAAHVTLRLLSKLSSAVLTPPGCVEPLQVFLASQAIFDNAAVLNPAGDVVCSLLPPPAGSNFADRSWFQTALKSRGFAISEFLTSRITARPSVVFALPVIKSGFGVSAIVAGSLTTRRLDRLIDLATLPAGSTVNLVDRNGAIILRHPTGHWLVKKHPAFDQLRPGIDPEGRQVKARGVDGVEQFYTFAPVRGSESGRAWFVSLGIPEPEIFRPVYKNFYRNLFWISLVGTLLITAWVGWERLVVRPVRRLVDVTTALANGDFKSPTGMANQLDELGRLASAFDQMTETLQAREAEREKTVRPRAHRHKSGWRSNQLEPGRRNSVRLRPGGNHRSGSLRSHPCGRSRMGQATS